MRLGEVTMAALHHAAWWLERDDAECAAFAAAAARSARPDADAFRLLAAALPWLRRLGHATLRPCRAPTPRDSRHGGAGPARRRSRAAGSGARVDGGRPTGRGCLCRALASRRPGRDRRAAGLARRRHSAAADHSARADGVGSRRARAARPAAHRAQALLRRGAPRVYTRIYASSPRIPAASSARSPMPRRCHPPVMPSRAATSTCTAVAAC